MRPGSTNELNDKQRRTVELASDSRSMWMQAWQLLRADWMRSTPHSRGPL